VKGIRRPTYSAVVFFASTPRCNPYWLSAEVFTRLLQDLQQFDICRREATSAPTLDFHTTEVR
jgi:hypothetical protein